ncbi:MAG: GntR family transcriptional regulator [Rhodoglobus sp.]|nr:GntR family transcriptional regulator [Rhodoglobus sp.]
MTEAADIYEQYRGMILSGRLGSGERLASVRQVANDLGVAIGTAAKAYKLLEAEGLVTTRAGAGTRVSATPAVLPASVVARIRELAAIAKRESATEDEVVAALRQVWKD